MKKSERMLTLHRACELLSLMPKRLLVKEITKKECVELWEFIQSTNRLSISQHMLKTGLAKECGVLLERIMEVANDAPFVQVLTWESCDEPSTHTLKEAMEMMRNAHLNENWILPFNQSISVAEATVIWKWALDYRWYSYRNRFNKWLRSESKLNTEQSFDIYLSVIFDGLSVPQSAPSFQRLSSWEGGTPDQWWFVTDCATLKYVGDGIVRNRNGTLNVKYTPLLNSKTECWMWENPMGTSHWHSTETPLPFSSYKEPMTHEWYESQVLLDSYAKGGFLIADKTKTSYGYKESKKPTYYLLSKGTNVLYAQILTIRNLDKGGYEIVIGFSDAGEVVDTTTHRMKTLPFVLHNALKRRGVHPNIRHAFHKVEDCLVAKFNHTWSPDDDWHLKFVDVEDDMGIEDVDDILNYFTIVGGEDES